MSAQVLERLVEETVALRRRVARLETLEAAVHGQGCRVYNSAATTLGSNDTATALSFNSERWDNDNCHSPTVNPTRLTCNTAGIYVITGSVVFAANASGYRFAGILLNSATYIGSDRRSATPTSSTVITVTAIYQLAAGDYVELRVAQTSGGNLDVMVVGNNSPEFAMIRVG